MDPGTAAIASAGINAVGSGKGGGGGQMDRDLLVPQEPQMTEVFKALYPILLRQIAAAGSRYDYTAPFEERMLRVLGQEMGNDRTQADIDRLRTNETMNANRAAEMAQAIGTGQGLGSGFTAGAALKAQNDASRNISTGTRQLTDPKYRIGQMMNALSGMQGISNPASALAFLGPLLQVQGALKPGVVPQGGGADPLAAFAGQALAGLDWSKIFPSGGGGDDGGDPFAGFQWPWGKST